MEIKRKKIKNNKEKYDLIYKVAVTLISIIVVVLFMIVRNYEKPTGEITVNIKGHVVNEGVYTLEKGSTISDAVELAGGFTDTADKEYINPAETLSDGEKIYIPAKSRDITDKININTASVTQLDSLPGIGAGTAERIVRYREKYGNFRYIDEIMNVKGIGEKTFDEIKGYITLG